MSVAHPPKQIGRDAARWAIILACGLAIALLAFRAVDLLRTPQPQLSASQIEAQALSLVETVTGQGNARLSIVENATGDRTAYVLLNDQKAVRGDAKLISEMLSGAGFIREGRDALTVRTISFAERGGLTLNESAELMALFAILCLTGAALILDRRTSEAQTAGLQPSLQNTFSETPTLQAQMPAPAKRDRSDLSDIVNQDPERAGTIVKQWIKHGEVA